ncbi:MAG: 2Fe-2S iron-sulfur cluster binding domain-containing protein, partial [Oscillospiraceae bacterium]|nr:2Fe-2S iron-sulfur cluster binding domain-containing protein [Oscillospiraceae bacterium]
MPKITFLPRQVTVDIPEGAPLLEAARLAGVPAETPCGGHGRCGKCLVRVLSGGVDARGYTGADGEVLLCQTNVRDEPVTVRLTSDLNAERGQFDRETGLARLDSEALSPLVEALSLTVAPPVFGDGLADLDRFE